MRTYQPHERRRRLSAAAQADLVVVLAGDVADELHLAPGHLLRQAGEGRGRRRDRGPHLGGEILRRLRIVVQLAIDLRDLFVVHAHVLLHQAQAVVELLDLDAQRAVPEAFEVRLHRLDRFAEQQRIPVAEVVLVVVVEVLGSHVSAARNGDLAVDHHRLVVHALVDAAEIGQHVQQALLHRNAYRGARVIDADVDVRMQGEREQRLVRCVDQQVVHDHPHAHAALRRGEQRVRCQDADVVRAPDEVLDVDRFLGVFRQPCACQKRFATRVQHVNSALPGVRRDMRVDDRHGRIVCGERGGRAYGAPGERCGDGPSSYSYCHVSTQLSLERIARDIPVGTR